MKITLNKILFCLIIFYIIHKINSNNINSNNINSNIEKFETSDNNELNFLSERKIVIGSNNGSILIFNLDGSLFKNIKFKNIKFKNNKIKNNKINLLGQVGDINGMIYLTTDSQVGKILGMPAIYLYYLQNVIPTDHSFQIFNSRGINPTSINKGIINNNEFLCIPNSKENKLYNSTALLHNLTTGQEYTICIQQLLRHVGLDTEVLKCKEDNFIYDINIHDNKVYILSLANEIIFSMDIGYKTFENIQIAYRFNGQLNCFNSQNSLGPKKIVFYYKYAYVLTKNTPYLYVFFNQKGKFNLIEKINLGNNGDKGGDIKIYTKSITFETFIIVSINSNNLQNNCLEIYSLNKNFGNLILVNKIYTKGYYPNRFYIKSFPSYTLLLVANKYSDLIKKSYGIVIVCKFQSTDPRQWNVNIGNTISFQTLDNHIPNLITLI
ncbi:hypothetical protein CPAV1605_1059 [seawater metagenome]|uniref:Uncharacterized protein n=1 Tax=seawater metagenome TaxID=1561972 RepID=A0A5E8CIV3_9ZZZZ